MSSRNAYLQYKRDTNRLVYWLVHTANSVPHDAGEPRITTSAITLSTLLDLSKTIPTRIKPIPSTIFRLFQSVIEARSKAFSFYQQVVTDSPDPEIEQSNVRHKAFLDVLQQAFELLGGEKWANDSAQTKEQDEEDQEEVIFANKFAKLDVTDAAENAAADVEESEEEKAKENKAPRKVQPKKGKGGKKKKKAKKSVPEIKEPGFDDVPLESFKIVEAGEGGLITDYLLAVYSMMEELNELRLYEMKLWKKVCAGKLNSAAAGTMCEVATAMVKQLQFEIGADFPGNGNFSAVMNTLTRGNPDTAQGMFAVGAYSIDEYTGEVVEKKNDPVDIKECFFVHTYRDLCTFITDFQKNKSGKPTKALASKLGLDRWDPNFNLRSASHEDRLKWRSAYTVNFLYDLVNLHSSVAVQRKNVKKQNIILETEDWRADGKWSEHRVLWGFGVREFAADITTLAMSKWPSAEIESRILPHHVFQLQCIVDSLAIWKGWKFHYFTGHTFTAPYDYKPTEDILTFLDHEEKGIDHAICLLPQLLQLDVIRNEDSSRGSFEKEILPLLRDDLKGFLGTSVLNSDIGLLAISKSRFLSSNRNGLWEYSPYLCGVGLVEALKFTTEFGLTVWERHSEPMAILHLYNFLYQKGWCPDIPVLDTLCQLFVEEVFGSDKVPTSNFLAVWRSALKVNTTVLGREVSGRYRDLRKRRQMSANNPLDPKNNHHFSRHSFLSLLHNANWRPNDIPDDKIPLNAHIGFLRIMEQRKKKAKNSVLLKRAEAGGFNLEQMGKGADAFAGVTERLKQPEIPDEMKQKVLKAMGKEDYKYGPSKPRVSQSSQFELNNAAFLHILERDVVNDITGNNTPYSGINHLFLLSIFLTYFAIVEKQCAHDELCRRAMSSKEFSGALVQIILESEDEHLGRELGGLLLETFQGAGLKGFVYWPMVDVIRSGYYASNAGDQSDGPENAEQCVVM